MFQSCLFRALVNHCTFLAKTLARVRGPRGASRPMWGGRGEARAESGSTGYPSGRSGQRDKPAGDWSRHLESETNKAGAAPGVNVPNRNIVVPNRNITVLNRNSAWCCLLAAQPCYRQKKYCTTALRVSAKQSNLSVAR